MNAEVWQEQPRAWGEIPGAVKTDLQDCLWREQSGLCIYCGRKLDRKPRVETQQTRLHIDHIEPRSTANHLMFDHGNLVLSCGHEYEKDIGPEGKTCGTARGNDRCPVPPYLATCRPRFIFLQADGAIAGVDGDDAAAAAIVHLNLNDRTLMAQRKTRWEEALKVINDTMAIEESDWDTAANEVLIATQKPDDHGDLGQFEHMVCYFLSRPPAAEPENGTIGRAPRVFG